MASPCPDRSRKGHIDAPIAPLIARINAHPSFFTTSSCSGRISVSLHPPNPSTSPNPTSSPARTKAAAWSFVSHHPADPQHIVDAVLASCAPQQQPQQQHLGLMVFRFEPFILAVECLDLPAAQALVSCAISSGFRESGVTSMRRRIIVAVRCSIRIETPIAEQGRLLVDEDYLRFLARIANEKMETNHQRTDRFLSAFIDQMESPSTDTHDSELTDLSVRRRLSIHEETKACYPREHKSDARNFQLNRRKLAELEKRQTLVLSRIYAVETALRESFRDFPGSNDTAGSAVVEVVDGFYPETGSPRGLQTQATEDMPGSDMPVKRRFADAVKTGLVERSSFQERGETEEPNSHDLEEKGRFQGAVFKSLRDYTEKLYRWGHTTCPLPCFLNAASTSLLVFGGYGGSVRQCRQNDLLLLDCNNGEVQSVCLENPPTPRVGHTASIVGQKMVVVGGREDPSKPLGDVCVLNWNKMQWIYPRVRGACFLPRHRHAAATVGEKIYVFGGLNKMDVLGDLHVLDTSIMQWSQVECAGDVPAARHSHSLSAVDQKLYLFGGFDGRRIFSDLSVLDLGNFIWHTVKVDSLSRFSHTMTVLNRNLLLLGGCPLTKQMNTISLLNLDKMEWRHERISLPSDSLLVRHTTTCIGNRLVLIGGGVSCYAFGTKFSPPFLVDLALLFPYMPVEFEKRAGTLANNFLKDEEMTNDHVWEIKATKVHAKFCKDTLKQLGWLDLRRKARVGDDGLHILFPITKEAASHLHIGNANCGPMERLKAIEKMVKGYCSAQNIENLMTLEIVKMTSAVELKCPRPPRGVLQDAIFILLEKYDLPASLLHEVPKRWERLDDMVVLPANSFTSEIWSSPGQELWIIVAKSLNAHRVARQAPVKATGTRDSNLRLLLGNNGWVQHHENGIRYCFDATKCMFSSGNISEKLRIAQMDCSAEVVVDLFAGIGYFVLPFLLRAKARRVYACEWNPAALDALRYNIHLNKVEDRCTVLEGDNRLTAPQGLADRVCLGLLPTSEHSWEVAVKTLRPEGGMLHIHGNVKDTEEQQWVNYVQTAITKISRSQDRHWDVHIAHIERVKWYAPHIRHMVVDIKCEVVTIVCPKI